MKRILRISALMLATAFSATAVAGDRDAVVGAMVGGGAGAYIGHSMNGRDGALIGGAIGAITGVALATQRRDREPERTVYDADRTGYSHDRNNGYDEDYAYERAYPTRVVYQQPAPVVYRPAPVVAYRPAPYIARYDRYDRHGWCHDRRHHHRGHHRGHGNGWDRSGDRDRDHDWDGRR